MSGLEICFPKGNSAQTFRNRILLEVACKQRSSARTVPYVLSSKWVEKFPKGKLWQFLYTGITWYMVRSGSPDGTFDGGMRDCRRSGPAPGGRRRQGDGTVDALGLTYDDSIIEHRLELRHVLGPANGPSLKGRNPARQGTRASSSQSPPTSTSWPDLALLTVQLVFDRFTRKQAHSQE